MNKFGKIKLGKRPYIIAEAGVNHSGNLNHAIKMIDAAAKSGANAIKFQSYKAERLASKFSPAYWDTKKEKTKTQFELFKKFDNFEISDYKKLSEHAKKKKIDFLSTPFDTNFVHSLNKLMPAFKIASADMNNFELLDAVSKYQKPVILSVGASKKNEIDESINFLKKRKVKNIAILHCVLCYPTKNIDANLSGISFLKENYPNLVIGYSDHLLPSANNFPLLLSWILGAQIIETHFTLDKKKVGNDHYHALDPRDLKNFVKSFDEVCLLLGKKEKRILKCEISARKNARRSIVASEKIKKGDIFQKKNLSLKRPGTGIEPKFLEKVIGLKANQNIHEDQIIKWKMVSKKVVKK